MKKIFKFMFLAFLVATTMTVISCKPSEEEVKEYTIEFYSDDVLINSYKAKEGDKIENIELASNLKEGYTFIGWFELEGTVLTDREVTSDKIIDGDLKLAAKWEINTYTIEFVDEDGKLLASNIVKHGEEIVAPSEPTKANDDLYSYQFAGWDKTFTTATSDMKITATYNKADILYTITFLDDKSEIIVEYKLKYGEKIIAPQVENIYPDEGAFYYEFLEWDVEFDIVEGDLEIYAMYQQARYKYYRIQFCDYNGEVIEELNVRERTTLQYDKEYQRKGSFAVKYTFLGWTTTKDSDEIFTLGEVVEKNMKLYPVYHEEINTTPFDFEKAKISILGDSISSFYAPTSPVNSYYTGNDEFYYPKYDTSVSSGYDTWWGIVLQQTKASLGINASLSGSTCYNWGSSTVPGPAMNDTRINLLGANGTPDIIIIYIGTNDNVNGFTDEQFTSAYQTMLQKINTRYPNTYVFCCTLGYTSWSGYEWTEDRRLRFNLIIRTLANENGASVIDFAVAQTSALNSPLHPNYSVMNVLGEYATNAIRNYFALK